MGSFATKSMQPFGVEIDFDLRIPLDAQQQQELQALRFKHHLLLFRNQSLSLSDQERVMTYLGPILTDVVDRMDFVSTEKGLGTFGRGIITFHSDLAFTPQPFHAISLHAIRVEDRATSTTFANVVDACQALPAALRARADKLEVFNCMAAANEGRAKDQDVPAHYPTATHPLVSRHPLTGQNYLASSFQHTIRVLGMAEEESEALLQELFSYIYAPANLYEHRWCKGDIVIWDNIALQHARLEEVAGTRTLQRVTGGEIGLIAMYPQMREIFAEDVADNLDRYGIQKKSGG